MKLSPSSLKFWKVGLLLGLVAWLVWNSYFVIKLDLGISNNLWVCGGDYHYCSYAEHFIEYVPRGTFIIMVDSLRYVSSALVAAAIILLPALLGYFVDMLRSKTN